MIDTPYSPLRRFLVGILTVAILSTALWLTFGQPQQFAQAEPQVPQVTATLNCATPAPSYPDPQQSLNASSYPYPYPVDNCTFNYIPVVNKQPSP